MRIAVMLRHLGQPGGIGVYTTSLLNALFTRDREHEYHALYSSPAFLGTFERFPNVAGHVLDAPGKLWWDQVAVPRFARAHAVDLIYNPKLSVPLATRSTTVLVSHGAEHFVVPHLFPWADRLYFTIANQLYYRSASAIIVGTSRGARDIAAHTSADPRKIHVINLAYNERCRVLPHEILGAVKAKYALPDRFILFVGGYEPRKNLRSILLAYEQLRHEFPHKLVVAGFPRWSYSDDIALLDRLGLRGDVIFTGFVDEELPALYNLADLFLFPSFYEGFGMPVLEAMACACPVVTTTTGCSPEVAGGAALLVDPHDADALATAGRRVLSDDRLRADLVRRGLARARQFSWNRCARETLALFESLRPGAARARAARVPATVRLSDR